MNPDTNPLTAETVSSALSATVARLSQGLVSVHGRRSYPLSGVAWSPELVLTTSRAVERDEGLELTLPSGARVGAALVGRDALLDLALLKVAEAALAAPTWVETEGLKLGQLLLRLGRPEGGVRVTLGVLMGLEPEARTPAGVKLGPQLLSDAATFRGFSGGPLVTAAGAVLGVGSAALARSGDALIPTVTVARTVAALLEHGQVRRGYLGLSAQPVRLPEALAAQAGQRAGLLVVGVAEKGPAAAAGLTVGDVLLKLGAVAVARPGALIAELDADTIGRTLELTLLRGGAVHTLSATVGARP